MYEEITTAAILLITMGTIIINPISLAVMILLISLLITIPIYNTSGSSWITYVLVITFSSGIMTLFIYTASLATNEVNNTNNNNNLIMILIITLSLPPTQQNKVQSSINFFSNYTIIIIIATILIVTLIAIISHGHSPHQTLNSSF